jgi:hypothetical protein
VEHRKKSMEQGAGSKEQGVLKILHSPGSLLHALHFFSLGLNLNLSLNLFIDLRDAGSKTTYQTGRDDQGLKSRQGNEMRCPWNSAP